MTLSESSRDESTRDESTRDESSRDESSRGTPFKDNGPLTSFPLPNSSWDHDMYTAAQETNREERKRHGVRGDSLPPADSKIVSEQAKALLDRKELWRPSWKDHGPAVEVETSVNVNAVDR